MRLVIGVGNSDRGDDAVGLAVARRVRTTAPPDVAVTELDGDQLALLEAWDGADDVHVVDAVCSGAKPGTVHRLDAAAGLGARFAYRGTHMFSLADVVELARALNRLPAHLVCHGIEGAAFEVGGPLSQEAQAAVRLVTAEILRELWGEGA
jgi:hydrogenase maturation protease